MASAFVNACIDNVPPLWRCTHGIFSHACPYCSCRHGVRRPTDEDTTHPCKFCLSQSLVGYAGMTHPLGDHAQMDRLRRTYKLRMRSVYRTADTPHATRLYGSDIVKILKATGLPPTPGNMIVLLRRLDDHLSLITYVRQEIYNCNAQSQSAGTAKIKFPWPSYEQIAHQYSRWLARVKKSISESIGELPLLIKVSSVDLVIPGYVSIQHMILQEYGMMREKRTLASRELQGQSKKRPSQNSKGNAKRPSKRLKMAVTDNSAASHDSDGMRGMHSVGGFAEAAEMPDSPPVSEDYSLVSTADTLVIHEETDPNTDNDEPGDQGCSDVVDGSAYWGCFI